jgi:hypothetical protein
MDQVQALTRRVEVLEGHAATKTKKRKASAVKKRTGGNNP